MAAECDDYAMGWSGSKIRLLNLELNEECRKVVTQLEHDGIGAVVIKGQSNLENYPEDLREYRNPGILTCGRNRLMIVEYLLRYSKGILWNMSITRG